MLTSATQSMVQGPAAPASPGRLLERPGGGRLLLRPTASETTGGPQVIWMHAKVQEAPMWMQCIHSFRK
jgi:hypothetical protein